MKVGRNVYLCLIIDKVERSAVFLSFFSVVDQTELRITVNVSVNVNYKFTIRYD